MNDYPASRARIRNLVRSPQTTAAPPAVTAPPVVPTVATGGACQGCEDMECGFCTPPAPSVCDRCQHDGADQLWESKGQIVLRLHLACVPDEPWQITARIAKVLAEDHDLVFATRDLRWRLIEEAS